MSIGKGLRIHEALGVKERGLSKPRGRLQKGEDHKMEKTFRGLLSVPAERMPWPSIKPKDGISGPISGLGA